MGTPPIAYGTNSAALSTPKATPYASNSNSPKAAPPHVTAHATAAQGADRNNTELMTALADWRTKPVTPLLFNGWHALMHKHDLVNKYPKVLSTLQHGAVIGVPLIRNSFSPPNKSSVTYYATHFQSILQREYSTYRQLGPFTQAQLEATIGPFPNIAAVHNTKSQQTRQIPPHTGFLIPPLPILPDPFHQRFFRLCPLPMHMGHLLYNSPLYNSAPARLTSSDKGRG